VKLKILIKEKKKILLKVKNLGHIENLLIKMKSLILNQIVKIIISVKNPKNKEENEVQSIIIKMKR
jgi:hypothetical protein